ncbi:hypothetical protein AX16_004064 [Volvariella volvacea WC 439]|nr:hypothetical protein AX16_004064 [Volvariella volvacea WC 439]
MKLTSAAALLLSSAITASAHATFQQLWVNGVDQGGVCVRAPQSNSPVTSVTSADLACNAGSRATSGICTVNAGGKVTIEMHQQPGDRNCAIEAIGGNHDGPVIVYLARVDDATTAVGAQANWFKIHELGLVRYDYWGTDVLNDNCGRMEVTIPSDIAPGDYLLRAEVIALHVAGSPGGAQFYMSCYQLRIAGNGNAAPATVRLPGAYSANDPGILFNLYGQYTSYTIPGPPVYGGGAPPAPPTSTASTTISTPPPVTSSTTATGPVASPWQQCGGSGWTGPTVCASPYTCVQVNEWYYQCQP